MTAVFFPNLTAPARSGVPGRLLTGAARRLTQATLARAMAGGLALGLAAAAVTAGMAQAQSGPDQAAPVFMELYTAQGCQACPPADALMLDLAGRDDVIAVALHVDYWDYIGWPDSFAQAAFSERQKDYARRHGHTTIYTPQVIVNGTEIVEGFRTDEVLSILARQAERRPEVSLSLSLDAATGQLSVNAAAMDEVAPQVALASRRVGAAPQANAAIGTLSMPGAQADAEPEMRLPQAARAPFVVELVRYAPTAQVEILAGENAGRLGEYANIVTEWTTIGHWDMLRPLELSVPAPGEDRIVVLIQEAGHGEVVAAARLP